jgi:hypothetical protein
MVRRVVIMLKRCRNVLSYLRNSYRTIPASVEMFPMVNRCVMSWLSWKDEEGHPMSQRND